MDFAFGIIIGTFVGFIVSVFMQGAAKNRRETEIYNEGFADGTKMEIRNKYKRLLAFCEIRQKYWSYEGDDRMLVQFSRDGAAKAYNEVIEKIKELECE